MGSALVIDGIADLAWRPYVERFVSTAIASGKAKEIVEPWMKPHDDPKLLDTFNLASQELFLEHAAKLEGLGDAGAAIDNSRWKNLLYWLHAVWLPLNGTVIQPVVVEVEGWPVHFCTASGLRRDLEDIASISKAGLGEKPALFDLMMENPKAYFRQTSGTTSTETETLRWIWYAFWTGAKMVEQLSTPMWKAD